MRNIHDEPNCYSGKRHMQQPSNAWAHDNTEKL